MSNFSSCLYVYLMGKKIFLIIVFLFASSFLYWCSGNSWFTYEFDDFYGVFDTEKSFESNWKDLNWLWYNLLKTSIIKVYSQKNPEQLQFTESIIITKRSSDKNVESFAKENIDNVDISWLKLSKWKSMEVKCNWITYSFVYYQWRYSMNQFNIYLSEWFLKVNQNIYIISYASLDEKSRNNFSSSFKTIQCK